MTDRKVRRQYGLWDSPITPLSLARGLRLSDVAWGGDGTLAWLEGRGDQGVVVIQPPEGQAHQHKQAWRDLNSEFSVRSRVGYGGGDFALGRDQAYFVEAESGRIYRQALYGGVAQPVTPAFGRCAAPKPSPDQHWLVFIHSYEGQDNLVIVPADGSAWPQKLVSGEDFYMQPAWHPEGRMLAWIAWNHPNMPWDGTLLRIGKLVFPGKGLPSPEDVQTIAGDEHTSIFQPEFSPDGRYLAFASDETGWWQIYLYDLVKDHIRQLTHGEAEHASPAWVQGLHTYSFSPDSQYLYFIRNQLGQATLWQADVSTGQLTQLHVGEEYTWIEQISVAPDGRRIAMITSGGKVPPRLIVYHLSGETQIVRRSMAEDLPADIYSLPQAITWQGLDGETVHGLFTPPQNPNFEGIGLPPLVILVHGGPTSQRTASFDPQAQFFTSRGYAVLQVNYRGSSGYGRAYRDKLRGNWGIYDVQDTVSGARHLIEQGQVDGQRVVIMGGSAGGFTVLKALQDFPGFFKAGINLFGVANQFRLAAETHKFEAHYSDSLLGPLPEAAAIYRERSPIFFVDKIQDPLAIFQGEIDEVVPRNQSDELVAALQGRGVPHVYHVYPGEGHGFRKPENIQHMYQAIEAFLKEYVIFA